MESYLIKKYPKISVIIIHFFGQKMLADCLESVFKSDFPNLEVFVVFNGDIDGSYAVIGEKFPKTKRILNKKNLGFAKANNQAIRKADGEFIFLLNDDTKIHPQLLSVLSDELKSKEIGIVGPKIFYMDEPEKIWFAGGKIDWQKQESYHLGRDLFEKEYQDGKKEVDFITGCALMIKKEVIEKIGLLDETFFAFFEDADWCQKAKRAGYKVLYVPFGGIWHIKSATAGNVLFGEEKNKNYLWLGLIYAWRYALKEARKYKNTLIFYQRYLVGRQKIMFYLKFIFIVTLKFLGILFFQIPLSLFKIMLKHS